MLPPVIDEIRRGEALYYADSRSTSHLAFICVPTSSAELTQRKWRRQNLGIGLRSVSAEAVSGPQLTGTSGHRFWPRACAGGNRCASEDPSHRGLCIALTRGFGDSLDPVRPAADGARQQVRDVARSRRSVVARSSRTPNGSRVPSRPHQGRRPRPLSRTQFGAVRLKTLRGPRFVGAPQGSSPHGRQTRSRGSMHGAHRTPPASRSRP